MYEIDERYPLVHDGFNTYTNTKALCYKVLDFLLDLPYMRSDGKITEPHEDGARADLIKYIFYDDNNPLANPLPTVPQKKQIKYDPLNPNDPPIGDKGYRIFGQSKTLETQKSSSVELRIFPAVVVPNNQSSGIFFIAFECWSNMQYKQLLNFEDRTYNMCLCILNALIGRNIDGIGTVFFDNSGDKGRGYCRLVDDLKDYYYNLGHTLVLGIEIGGYCNDFR